MLRNRRIDTLNKGYYREPSVLVVLASVISVVGLVWLVLRMGNDPMERVTLPDDAQLARFMLVPGSGPWLGINMDGPETVIQPNGRLPRGVQVTGVMINSPAAAAGLRQGDVITRVDGNKVQMPVQLRQAVADKKQGDSVRLVIERAGQRKVVRARLGSAPAIRLAAATAPVAAGAPATAAPVKPSKPWLGVDVQPLDQLLINKLGLADKNGVVISNVYPNSPAMAAGLQQGDVIRSVNQTPLSDLNQFAGLISTHRPGEALSMSVWRGKAANNISVTLSAPPPPGTQPPPTLPEPEVEIEAAWLGLDIIPLTKIEAQELGLPANLRGMLVDGIAPGAGVDAGFQQGDVIIAVNGVATQSINDFKEAAEGAVGALVDVIRYGRHVYISVPPPGNTAAGGRQKPQLRQVNWMELW